MHALGLQRHTVAPSAAASTTVEAIVVGEVGFDGPGLWIPRAEPHLVVRWGSAARSAFELHVMGARQRAHRKVLRSGQRTLMARLRLGTHRALFGAPSSSLAEHIVSLSDLWGDDATRLGEQLARARDLDHAAALLQDAIVRRLDAHPPDASHTRVALAAAARLATSRVNDVADDLGVSERNLRRVFRDAVGMSPKAYARLVRFQRALAAAQSQSTGSHRVDWAGIAVDAGYYDQAHLIAEFREVAGVTPGALLREIGGVAPPRGTAEGSACRASERLRRVGLIGIRSMSTTAAKPPATTDLCDAHADVRVLAPLFRDFGGKRAFFGRARTLRLHEDNALVRSALEMRVQGDVLVIDGGGSLRTALVGGNLGKLAQANGWAGIVVHGAVRDSAELAQCAVGIKALAAIPRKSAKAGAGEHAVAVTFASVTIAPGEWIYADDDGIVVSERALHGD